MTDGTAIERPVLWGDVGSPAPFSPTTGGGSKVDVPSRGKQGSRLGGKFEDLDDAFAEQATLTESLGASDPQLVVVFEAVDERVDLARVADSRASKSLPRSNVTMTPTRTFPVRPSIRIYLSTAVSMRYASTSSRRPIFWVSGDCGNKPVALTRATRRCVTSSVI